ncbi:hypothetical protein HDIA_3367 [Hartmannibacter diazotrophicus]|uniref:Zinc-ribbon domain-containing protein n=1 Tax=Hartmannibacter diazotrophicus TaxID=1482074 RepID=A0A2C9D9U2_9HYPH|nr:putative zinc-binding peptidase [Hartmannibacter diazotrophicus]SON56908.1 hypothetical protein HDIA_3367 [Hartmannibacter diazotrophicus]
MKIFECQSCGNAVHFDNTACLQCGHWLGYIPGLAGMSAVEEDNGVWRALIDGGSYFFCDNAKRDACNWLLPARHGPGLCAACRHNQTVPDLTQPENQTRWVKLERAKRHLFYSLTRWQLPMPSRTEDPNEGLAFDFMADVTKPDGTVEPVMTGHQDGLITINIAEADDVEREGRRTAMAEPYRTLLGHFRHEVGHFYWNLLVRDGGRLDGFRHIFGDERADYGEALEQHYEQGPRADWPLHHISSYASAHPWEDFAETFAHYVHMVDGLETARSYGIAIRAHVDVGDGLESPMAANPYHTERVDDLIEPWVPLTVAMNSLSRSMGQPDLYPFILSEPVKEKLGFVHDLIRSARDPSAPR